VRRVVVLGTSKRTRGGVAAVLRQYELAGLPQRWPLVHLATHADGTALRKLGIAACAWLRFLALLATRRVLLVHVHCASNASFWRKSAFILLALLGRRPVIFHLHGGGFVEFYNGGSGMRRRFIRFVLDRVSEIVVLTEEWRGYVARMTRNENVSVIANPVDAGRERGVPREANAILFLGRLDKDKGIFELVDALTTVRERIPGAKVWFAGDGDRQALAGYAEKRGVASAIEFFGWVDNDEKRKLLARAMVYALPSRMEGLPMAVLEALAAGLPIVATRVGGIPGVIEDEKTGLLVPPRDPQALASALCRLLEDRELRSRLARAGRRTVEDRFAPERVLPRIELLYAKLAGGRAPAGAHRAGY